MYAFFPLLLAALACGLLGAWLLADAGFRRLPALAWAGRCLIAVLPLVGVGLVAAALFPAAGAVVRAGLLAGASLLLLAAAAIAGGLRLRAHRHSHPSPAPPSLLGPTLLLPAIGIIAACFVLSLLLALSNGTLGF